MNKINARFLKYGENAYWFIYLSSFKFCLYIFVFFASSVPVVPIVQSEARGAEPHVAFVELVRDERFPGRHSDPDAKVEFAAVHKERVLNVLLGNETLLGAANVVKDVKSVAETLDTPALTFFFI